MPRKANVKIEEIIDEKPLKRVGKKKKAAGAKKKKPAGAKKRPLNAFIKFVLAHWKKKTETYSEALKRCAVLYKKAK